MSVAPTVVSVITPSFNKDENIEHTMLSFLGPDYPVIEYIVIDGGLLEEVWRSLRVIQTG